MKSIDEKFFQFIDDHHVLTLATCKDNMPWCASCFYTYIPEDNCFVITSSDDTRHIENVHQNSNVAANIVLETKTVGKIQGLQLSGTLTLPEGDEKKRVTKAYLKKFPFAALMSTKLWVLKVEYMKLTDNRLGFGKKLIWDKSTDA